MELLYFQYVQYNFFYVIQHPKAEKEMLSMT